jgi:hypothetical protein
MWGVVLWCVRHVSGALNMRKIIVATCALMGLGACAASEGVQQAAIANCLQVGIAQNDPQFPTCTRSYALQQQDGALNRNYNLYTIQQDMKQSDWILNRRQDAFRK